MKIGAIICFVLAALGFVSAVRTVLIGENVPEEGAVVVSYIVGAFLFPMVLLIVGLILWGKAKK